MKDEVGDQLEASNAAWSFGGKVPKNFQKHAKRSIPFYEEGHRLIAYISDFFLNNGSLCYDIGTSTGELINILDRRHSEKNIKYIGVDQEEKMITEAKKRFKNHPNVEFIKNNITEIEWQNANLIISYYTIQFCPLKDRERLIKNIYNNLNKGGAFLFFEKVFAEDSKLENISQAVYTDYKLDEGYTANDIVNKSRSLKGILEPLTSSKNELMLKKAGFENITNIFRWVNFEGILAIK
jgi:tRNA (cmo5U34)-methyltransferase